MNSNMPEERWIHPSWLPEGKEFKIAFWLCLGFGTVGAHNFYLGENKKGILRLLTLCIPIIGWVVDVVLWILDACRMYKGTYKYSQGWTL